MITYNNYTFFQDGHPILLLAGEIHYFRLPRHTWDMHLDKALHMGLNTISTYVPWIVHVEREDNVDFGATKENYDLKAFITLANQKGLKVFLRPGPYIMAELMNEGIPEWVFEKYADIKANTLNHVSAKGPIVDYLHEGFLHEVALWYKQVLNEVRPFLQDVGGPIFGIQLDNEIGMLPWVTKQTILDPESLDHLQSIKHPFEQRMLAGKMERDYYMRYAVCLKAIFDDLDINHVLYFINIHGTSHGRGKTFPVGISQLLDTWQKQSMIPGTDVYFGDLTIENFHDYYIIHSLLESTLRGDQPLSSLEFNVGDGNFGDNLASRNAAAAADMKLRMNIAQNYKMINYYLLTGGFNPLFKHGPLRGNPFVAITGERHGFAAPIQPDGTTSYTFERLSQTTQMLNNLSHYIAPMKQEKDTIALVWISDQYMTTLISSDNKAMEDVQKHHEMHRNSVLWDVVIKHLLLLGYQLDSYDLDNHQKTMSAYKMLIFPVTKYMSHIHQLNIIDYLKSGGKAIFVGECPTHNLNGEPDSTLMDYLHVIPHEITYDWETDFIYLKSDIAFKGSHVFRSYYAQDLDSSHKPLFKNYKSGKSVGVIADNFILITSTYPGHLEFTHYLMDYLNMKPMISLSEHTGHIMTLLQTHQQSSFLHLINLDRFDERVRITYKDHALFDGLMLDVMGEEAMMLPINIDTGFCLIEFSTAEIISIQHNAILFRLTQACDVIKLKTPYHIEYSKDFTIVTMEDHFIIKSLKHAKVDPWLEVKFKI